MTKESYFLLFISIGVFPAALGYGLNPKEFLPVLYGIEVADNNLSNIFRAIMGLYTVSYTQLTLPTNREV